MGSLVALGIMWRLGSILGLWHSPRCSYFSRPTICRVIPRCVKHWYLPIKIASSEKFNQGTKYDYVQSFTWENLRKQNHNREGWIENRRGKARKREFALAYISSRELKPNKKCKLHVVIKWKPDKIRREKNINRIKLAVTLEGFKSKMS